MIRADEEGVNAIKLSAVAWFLELASATVQICCLFAEKKVLVCRAIEELERWLPFIILWRKCYARQLKGNRKHPQVCCCLHGSLRSNNLKMGESDTHTSVP